MRTATVRPLAFTVAAALAAALAAGCADDGRTPSGPQPDAASPAVATAAGTAATVATTAAATADTAGAAQAADTTRPTTFPGAVRVRGRVLATVWAPGRTAADTLSGFQPVLGARVTLYRNVLVDGRGVSQRIGEQETGTDGTFVFEGVPGGPYVLALNVGPGRPYGEALQYLMGNAPEVSATLRLWLRPSAPTDSTGGP
jgi:hypothetical protein